MSGVSSWTINDGNRPTFPFDSPIQKPSSTKFGCFDCTQMSWPSVKLSSSSQVAAQLNNALTHTSEYNNRNNIHICTTDTYLYNLYNIYMYSLSVYDTLTSCCWHSNYSNDMLLYHMVWGYRSAGCIRLHKWVLRWRLKIATIWHSQGCDAACSMQ